MARIFSNATNQKLVAPSSTVLNLGTSDFTIAVWVLRPIVGANDTVIVGKRNWDNGIGWELKIRDATNRTIRFDVQTNLTGRQRAEGAVPNLNDGAWHLLIGRRATASYLDFWADNSLIATAAVATTGSVDNALNFNISGSPDVATRAFDGWIAEPAIFRRILSVEEMTELFKRFSPYFKRPSIHFPLIGRSSPEPDVWGGSQAALVNAPTTGAHLRIRMPTIGQAPFTGEPQALAGSIDGQSATAGFLSAEVPVAGSVDGASSLDNSWLRLNRGIWATLDGFGELTGSMLADVPIAGAFAGTSDFTSRLDVNWKASGLLHGDGIPSGFLSATLPIKGIVPAAGDFAGFLSAAGPGLDGAIHGTSAVAGKLSATVPLAGALAGVSAISPTLTRIRWLASVLQGSGVLLASLRYKIGARGRIDGESDWMADPSVAFSVRGSLDGESDLTARTTSTLALLGTLAGSGALAGRLLAIVDLAGNFGAASALSAFLRRRVPEGGSLAGTATFNADLSAIPWLKGSIEAQSDLSAILYRELGLRGSLEGLSVLSGRLRIPGELEQTNVGGRVVVRPENGVGGFVARWYRGDP